MHDPTQGKYRHALIRNSESYRRFSSKGKDLFLSDFVAHNHEIPAHGSYGALLFSPQWRARREEILTRDQHACVICRQTAGLQVHHRQYHFIVSENRFKLPWDYPDHILITLCESCHQRGHNKFKVPTINI